MRLGPEPLSAPLPQQHRRAPEVGISLVVDREPPLLLAGIERRVEAAARASGERWETWTLGTCEDVSALNYDVWILLAPAREVGKLLPSGRPRHAGTSVVWWWMGEEADPVDFAAAIDAVDEVWVPTAYASGRIEDRHDRIVEVVPLPVEAAPPAYSPRELGLPDGFLFLTLFDAEQEVERQNPAGVIDAFTRAFAPGDGPELVVVAGDSSGGVSEIEGLRHRAGGRPDVHIIAGPVSEERRASLLAAADCVVSLHRSEVFGSHLAEAMALGRPVAATGWSGPTDFVRDATGYLIGWRPALGAAGTLWAEPDLDSAARVLQQVWNAPGQAWERAARAAGDVVCLSPVAIGRRIADVATAIRDRAAGRSSGTALERVAGHVARPPGGEERSRWGPLGGVARRGLLRILKPYWWGQHQLDRAILDALREGEAARRIDRETAGDSVAARVAEAEARLRDALGFELERLGSTTPASDGGMPMRRHDELLERLDAMAREVAQLRAELQAVPEVSDGAAWRTRDPWGRTTIGFGPGQPPVAREDLYARFEDLFRGPESVIRERQRIYQELLADRGPVVDVGCGRGELLDLLGDKSVEAIGVDVDEGMVRRCLHKGHDARQGDGIAFLEAAPDHAFGAIFSAQVIEHMTHDVFVRFLELGLRKLRPGGLFIAETVNPSAIPAWKTFWVDLTHRTQIFPEVAVAFCRLLGYESAFVLFPNGSGDLQSDRFQHGEYAVVAQAPAAS